MRLILSLLALLALSACAVAPTDTGESVTIAPEVQARADRAARRFIAVVNKVGPVAGAECRRRTRARNCDFLIVVDDRLNQPPNAYQTVDRSGRPVIAFTLGLIARAQNGDELAFVMGHEAAHHIAGHIEQRHANAQTGASVLGGLAQAAGAGPAAIRRAEALGAAVGARSYSKEHELEADRLGAIIALRAGYDPMKGAAFFLRIPDPGDQFLGTHPPNTARIDTIRRVMAGS